MLALRKILWLKPEQRTLLLLAFILLAYIRIGLATVRFKGLNGHLPKVTALIERLWRLRFGAHHRVSVDRIAWAVSTSNRWQPGDAMCLAKALATQTLLFSQKYQPQLRIGVAKDAAGGIKAHAWIIEQDKVVMGALDDLDSYVPFPTTSNADLVLARISQ